MKGRVYSYYIDGFQWDNASSINTPGILGSTTGNTIKRKIAKGPFEVNSRYICFEGVLDSDPFKKSNVLRDGV